MKLLSSKQELNDTLIRIIKESEKTLKIVSPFMDFEESWVSEQEFEQKQMWHKLIDLMKEKKDILEIYTKEKFDGKEKAIEFAKNEIGIDIKNIIDIRALHAKIYINDNMALLSSMNLLYPSFIGSIVEFGIVAEKKENEAEYKNILDYCKENIFKFKQHWENTKSAVENYFSCNGICATFCDNDGLRLIKNENTDIWCDVDLKHKPKDEIYFKIGIKENRILIKKDNNYTITNGREEIELNWNEGNKRYCFIVKDNYHDGARNPLLYITEKKILEILVRIYNAIDA